VDERRQGALIMYRALVQLKMLRFRPYLEEMVDACATLGLSALPRLSRDLTDMLREVTSTKAELDSAARDKGGATASESPKVIGTHQTSLAGHKRKLAILPQGLKRKKMTYRRTVVNKRIRFA
jgi:hypothetical protein